MTEVKITINDECLKIYNEMKDKHKYGYSIFKFSDDFKYLIVDKTASPEKTYDDFLNDLPPNDIRIALLDSSLIRRYPLSSNVYYIYWVPDTVPIRVKMFAVYAIHIIKSVFTAAISDVGLQAEIYI